MSNLMKMLGGVITDQVVNSMSKQVGANSNQTGGAIKALLPLMIGAMTKNAKGGGVNALAGALDRDHDGSILDNLGGLLSNKPTNAGGILQQLASGHQEKNKALDGSGILKHLFGGHQQGIQQAVSQSQGLNTQATANIMQMLAPVLMGALGKQKRQSNLDGNGLMSLLQGESQSLEKDNKTQGAMLQLLDRDGDGNIMDDLIGLLGKR